MFFPITPVYDIEIGANLGIEALFFNAGIRGLGIGGRSSSIRALWERTQLLMLLKPGRLPTDDRILAAASRGVVGACEFVQLHLSFSNCLECCDLGESGGLARPASRSSVVVALRIDTIGADSFEEPFGPTCRGSGSTVRACPGLLTTLCGGLASNRNERPCTSRSGVCGAVGG